MTSFPIDDMFSGNEGKPPCHYTFTYTETKPGGGSITCLYLEAEKTADIPTGATDIRAFNVGDIVYEYQTAFGTCKAIHSHSVEADRTSPFEEYKFIGKISQEIPGSPLDAVLMKIVDYLDGIRK